MLHYWRSCVSGFRKTGCAFPGSSDTFSKKLIVLKVTKGLSFGAVFVSSLGNLLQDHFSIILFCPKRADSCHTDISSDHKRLTGLEITHTCVGLNCTTHISVLVGHLTYHQHAEKEICLALTMSESSHQKSSKCQKRLIPYSNRMSEDSLQQRCLEGAPPVDASCNSSSSWTQVSPEW